MFLLTSMSRNVNFFQAFVHNTRAFLIKIIDDTVNHLLKEYGVDRICMCVGSDMLYCFEKWKCAEELMKKCVLYSKARVENEYAKLCCHGRYLEEKYGAEIHIMNGSVLEVSSTELRNSEKNSLIDIRVSDYIKKHGLYS